MMDIVKKARPVLQGHYCKGCGRCIESCAHHSIRAGDTIDPATGLIPVVLDLTSCTSCGLCLAACPEPYGLLAEVESVPAEARLAEKLVPHKAPPSTARAVPDELIRLPATRHLVVRGNYAAAIGALLAGCRHFFGYPITPSSEGAELMAKLLPDLNGFFVQAVSEVATINMMYGCGAAGKRALTFTSSPGFSLMLEGLSYMVGAEVPAVVINVMRGGPGLGNIGPEQADIKLACRGLGHGNTHAIVLAPSTPQEMLDLTMQAFDLAFRYRNPVIVLADGYLGQMTGKVTLPQFMVKPGLPEWAVSGDREHRGNLISSIQLAEVDLEAHNAQLLDKYLKIQGAEARADLFRCEDADIVLVACNTPSRMTKGAVDELRRRGVAAGLFRPLTLWPFPIDALLPLLHRASGVVVVEASHGQLEDELRLALSHADVRRVPRIRHVRHSGGVLPDLAEIVEAVLAPRSEEVVA